MQKTVMREMIWRKAKSWGGSEKNSERWSWCDDGWQTVPEAASSPATGNTRSPTVDSRVRQITSCKENDDQRRWHSRMITKIRFSVDYFATATHCRPFKLHVNSQPVNISPVPLFSSPFSFPLPSFSLFPSLSIADLSCPVGAGALPQLHLIIIIIIKFLVKSLHMQPHKNHHTNNE